MTLEQYYADVIAALQAEPHNRSSEIAVALCASQPKSMKIFHANETVESGATLILEGWQPEE